MKRLLFLLTPAILPNGWPQLDAVCEPSPRVWSFARARSAFSGSPKDRRRRGSTRPDAKETASPHSNRGRARQKPPAGSPRLLRVQKKGVSEFDLRDPYHLAIALSWPQSFLALLTPTYQ